MIRHQINDRSTVVLMGSLTLQSPYASSPPDSRDRDKVARLPRMAVNIDGVFVDQPVISAASIRGRLRRAAATIVRDRFLATGAEIRFADWLLWSVGGVKSSGQEKIDISKRQQIIENNALLAMFGAGESPAGGMVGGRLLIDPGIPTSNAPTEIVKGARRAENRNPDLSDFLSPQEMDEVETYSQNQSTRSRNKASIKDLQKRADTWKRAVRDGKNPPHDEAEQELLLSEIAQIATNNETTPGNAIGMPIPGGYEVLPAGLSVPHRITIRSATPTQIGLIVAALELFATDPVIGAHAATGCGRIQLDYRIHQRLPMQTKMESSGTLQINDVDNPYEMKTDSEFLLDCLDAWNGTQFDPDAYRA